MLRSLLFKTLFFRATLYLIEVQAFLGIKLQKAFLLNIFIVHLSLKLISGLFDIRENGA